MINIIKKILIIGMVLFVVAACVAIVRLRPSITAWQLRRHEAWLSSETWAFAQASAAFRAHDFPGAVRAVELWSSRLGPVSGTAEERLAKALSSLGAAMYGPVQNLSSEQTWSGAAGALLDARKARLAASSATYSIRALPPLNPRQVS